MTYWAFDNCGKMPLQQGKVVVAVIQAEGRVCKKKYIWHGGIDFIEGYFG